MGLRELKKARTRQAVERAAMQLFSARGYAATTVEQIAAAAEISTATFYRYYRDKEDIVFGEDDRALVQEVISGRPAEEAIADTIGALFARLAAEVEGDRDGSIVRMRLMHGVPGLRARRWATRQKTADLLAALLAPRAGIEPDDPRLRLAIAISLTAEAEVLHYWARIGGTESLVGLLADALTTIEPVLRIRTPAADARRTQAAVGSGALAERAAADPTLSQGKPARAHRPAARRPAAATETGPLPI
jgi:AcrR family transcriptional regulator